MVAEKFFRFSIDNFRWIYYSTSAGRNPQKEDEMSSKIGLLHFDGIYEDGSDHSCWIAFTETNAARNELLAHFGSAEHPDVVLLNQEDGVVLRHSEFWDTTIEVVKITSDLTIGEWLSCEAKSLQLWKALLLSRIY